MRVVAGTPGVARSSPRPATAPARRPTACARRSSTPCGAGARSTTAAVRRPVRRQRGAGHRGAVAGRGARHVRRRRPPPPAARSRRNLDACGLADRADGRGATGPSGSWPRCRRTPGSTWRFCDPPYAFDGWDGAAGGPARRPRRGRVGRPGRRCPPGGTLVARAALRRHLGRLPRRPTARRGDSDVGVPRGDVDYVGPVHLRPAACAVTRSRPVTTVLYPGSFDPIHNGHIEIIEVAVAPVRRGRRRSGPQSAEGRRRCSRSRSARA